MSDQTKILAEQAVAAGYSQKPSQYFSGARVAFVDRLPLNKSARLLDIGCGNGDSAAYARSSGKCGWCAGIELCPEPASIAASILDQIFVGDVEAMTLPFAPASIDILFLSEVLEHLRDPWALLRKLHSILAPNAIILAGSPNVAHHSVLRMLLRGGWHLTPTGIMDRTHLRWFTPATYRQLFEDCGFAVELVEPSTPLRAKARIFNIVTAGCLEHLLHTQILLKAYKR